MPNNKRVLVTPPMLAEYPGLFDPLRDKGLEVVINDGPYPMNAAQLAVFLQDAMAAVIGLDEVPACVFEACPTLSIIARNGVGMDNVDVAAASRHGVIITAPFGANSTSVAELTIGLLIALVRLVVANHNRAQQGVWKRIPGMELSGKTLGIIGLGRIGKKVARRARAFNLTVIAHDIAPDHYFAGEHEIRMVSRDVLLAESDIVSLHVPLTPLTRYMMNRDTFAQMKPGAYLLNTARGAVVDMVALAQVLDSGHLAGAALDVHMVESAVDAAMLGRPNVITTTHLGAYTHDALLNTAAMAVDSIIQVLENKQPSGLINPEAWEHRFQL